MKNLKKYLAGSLVFLTIMACNPKDCVEKQNQDCFCYQVWAPVCGCNGITYGNDCEALCRGIKHFTEGVCKK